MHLVCLSVSVLINIFSNVLKLTYVIQIYNRMFCIENAVYRTNGSCKCFFDCLEIDKLSYGLLFCIENDAYKTNGSCIETHKSIPIHYGHDNFLKKCILICLSYTKYSKIIWK